MLKGYSKYVLRPLQIYLKTLINDIEYELENGRLTNETQLKEFLKRGTTNTSNNKEIQEIVEKAYELAIDNAVLQFKRELNQINSFLNWKTGDRYIVNTEFTRTQLRVLMTNKYYSMKEISKYCKRYEVGLAEDITRIFIELNKEAELKNKDKFQVLQHIKISTQKDLSKKRDVETQKALKKFYNNFTRLVSTQAQRAYQDTKYILHGESKEKVLDPFLLGYKWKATGSRACAICRARNNKFFEPYEVPYDHPRGMCDLEEVYNKNTNKILTTWVKNETNKEEDKLIEAYIKHLEKIDLIKKIDK